MLAPEDLTDRDPIDLIAEEFAARCRSGERPTVDEYVARYPERAEELRVLLPTVGFLERGRSEMVKSRTGDPEASTRIGDHRIVGEIGRGGMGIVYEAIQEPLSRRVAVKVLPRPSAADARSRERFLREAKAVARLKHPHIVPIYSVGDWENVPYYVMALIDGMGLDRPQGAPKETVARANWVARLGVQAAEALAHAHGQGILHRDVKPANILVEPNGHLWLTDFGLAKLADDLSLTETGGLPGTLRYMAPECLDADGDERSDVYSLGLTLYEVLLGRPAFGESNRVRLLQQVRDAEAPRPRTIDPAIPRDMETVLLKAMARQPASRYASAQEFADDLTRYLELRPIKARPVGSVERFVSLLKRNPLVSGLSAATLLLALISTYFVRYYLLTPTRDGSRNETAAGAGETLKKAIDPIPEEFPDGPIPPDAPPLRGDDPRRREPPPFMRGEFGPDGRDRPRMGGPGGPGGGRGGPGGPGGGFGPMRKGQRPPPPDDGEPPDVDPPPRPPLDGRGPDGPPPRGGRGPDGRRGNEPRKPF